LIFSLHTDDHVKKAKDIYGYAYGYKSIKEYFGKFKYKGKTLVVGENTPNSQVQMFYMEPEWYNLENNSSFRHPKFQKFYDHQYKIYGTHLESTAVWPHWVDSMNQVDEIWVGNQFAADAVTSSKVKTPVYVFEHGIDDIWEPKKRGAGGKIRFLHVDSGSPRKRSDLVERAFTELFGNNKNVELTLKYHSSDGASVLSLFDNGHSNVRKIFQTLPQEEMVKLYHDHDVLVYPSEGEGFGFIPLQALCTGMPVISTSRWCSYDKYFKDNIIESKLGPTSHTGYLYGDVVLAEYKSLLELMEKVYKDIEKECEFFYKQAPSVYKEYNWENKCNVMLKSFIKRVGIDMMEPTNDFAETMYEIEYTGSGKYVVSGTNVYGEKSSFKFDPGNRHAFVDKRTYDSLISQEFFTDPIPS
jgi:glycosyltransferase involved in cell wall biosynthesis